MQLHKVDPDYAGSAKSLANFRLALRFSALLVFVLWAVHLADAFFDLNLNRFGIAPRHFSGLTGVLFAPLLHGSFAHLISNSLPLLVLATGLLYLYPNSALTVAPAVWLGAGAVVWLIGRESLHIGASGLVYGLATYIFVAGVIRRDVRAIAASLLVFFLYGSLLWGLLPVASKVSWETHLAAAGIGVVLAVALRKLDIPPRKRYAWEDEEDGEVEDFR